MSDVERVVCGASDLHGRYTCNREQGHEGAHMELTDRHSAAWDIGRGDE